MTPRRTPVSRAWALLRRVEAQGGDKDVFLWGFVPGSRAEEEALASKSVSSPRLCYSPLPSGQRFPRLPSAAPGKSFLTLLVTGASLIPAGKE